MENAIARVIRIAENCSGCTSLGKASAVDQDMKIWGDDMVWFSSELAQAFGYQVRQWPWTRFASLDQGPSLLAPFKLIWKLVTWSIRGSFGYHYSLERLELGRIAAIIDNGEWFGP